MSYFSGLENALPKLWNDRIRIAGIQPIKRGYIANNKGVAIAEDKPTKVVSKGQSIGERSFFDADGYDAELIIRNGIKTPAGADIYVTDVNGQMTKYEHASKDYSGYLGHQEVATVKGEKA